jgi:PAS domain S-box-containing protein
MKTTLSLGRVIALAVIVGLLAPGLLSGWQTVQQRRTTLTAALEADHQRLAMLLAHGMSGALWSLDNDTLKLLTDTGALDERVVRIAVSSAQLDNPAEFYRPERQHGRLLSVTEPIAWKGKPLGHVRVEMDTGQLESRLNQELARFLVTAAAQLALSLALILLVLNVRFVAPVKRLLEQSVHLARRELDQPFDWQRRDELGTLGNSLESTRLSLQASFKELQESEERFRSLAALSSDWYWERDEEGRMTLLSQGFAEITGFDPNERLGTRRGEDGRFQYPADQACDCEARIAAHEPFYGLEWQIVRPDGQLRHGTTSGEPIFDSEGRFRGYRGIGNDTTAVKLAESAQQSVIRLREMVEHLPAGAVYIEGGAILLNRAAEAITGYSRSEIGSVDEWFDRVCGADAERVRRQYAADRAAQFPAAREIAIVRKDGTQRFIEFAGYGDANGEVWLLHDITQRRTTQAALEHALREQQVIFDNATVMMVLVKDRVIQRCNRGLEKTLGYAPGELVGRSTRVFHVSGEAYEAFGDAAYPAIAAGRAWSTEHSVMRKDGSQLWCTVQGSLIDPQDPSAGAIFVAQDISERKRNEAALMAANEQLERGLAEVERTQREIALLSELSGFLQACPTEAEAAAGIGEYAPRLLPEGLGALYLIDDAEDTLVAKVRWGDPSIALATTFVSDECWALRRAHAYRLDHPTRARCCPHLGAHGAEHGAYACLPLTAQRRIFGLLFVEHRGVPDERQIEARHRLAVALAEQVGLGLANIRLRETLRQQSVSGRAGR